MGTHALPVADHQSGPQTTNSVVLHNRLCGSGCHSILIVTGSESLASRFCENARQDLGKR